MCSPAAARHVKQVAGLLAQMVPAIVVFDDIDLIAEDRDNAGNAGATLFNLLDAMDGMREDVDVQFICTTHRVEQLEKAISSRPGRIDQAIEVAVPDRECRARPVALYAKGLDLQLTDLDGVLDRTAGVTASFIKELLRRATLLGRGRHRADRDLAGHRDRCTPARCTRHPARPEPAAHLGSARHP